VDGELPGGGGAGLATSTGRVGHGVGGLVRISGGSLQIQYITPYYVAGDVIVACRTITGHVEPTDSQPPVPVEWMDLNVASRTWGSAESQPAPLGVTPYLFPRQLSNNMEGPPSNPIGGFGITGLGSFTIPRVGDSQGNFYTAGLLSWTVSWLGGTAQEGDTFRLNLYVNGTANTNGGANLHLNCVVGKVNLGNIPMGTASGTTFIPPDADTITLTADNFTGGTIQILDCLILTQVGYHPA
jgi:hypothetical protein